MAKGARQKMKLLYLMKILMERTDEEHFMTISQMVEALAELGIGAERKACTMIWRHCGPLGWMLKAGEGKILATILQAEPLNCLN